MRQPDLLVAGAGPAGVAAAITAADRGLTVVLADKASFPREKTCGDGLTTAALRHLQELGLDLRSLPGGYATVRETVVVSPSGRRMLLPSPGGAGEYVAVVPRVELDAALVRLARDRGVEVREEAAVTDVVPSAASVKLRLADGSGFEPRFVVAADGHYSTVRRLLCGDRRVLGTWHAQRQYFEGVDDDGGTDERPMWIVFMAGMLPGYGWVFPLPGGRANVGFGVLRDQGRSGRDLAALWRILLEHPAVREALGPRARPVDRPRAWPIPCAFDRRALTAGRVLFAGDAASVVDPMTGEGVAQAIETGTLAAAAVAGGGEAEAVAARYRRAVQRSLATDLWFSRLLQRPLRHRKGVRAAIRIAGLTPWTRRNFARWLYEDYPRAAVLTPRRWHRGMFTGPGAFHAPRNPQ